jgi:hypothetical protein
MHVKSLALVFKYLLLFYSYIKSSRLFNKWIFKQLEELKNRQFCLL